MTKPISIAKNISLSDFIAAKLEQYFIELNGHKPSASLYDQIMLEVERPLIQSALTFCNGNQVKASHLLGINRNTLRKKIKTLGEGDGAAPKKQE